MPCAGPARRLRWGHRALRPPRELPARTGAHGGGSPRGDAEHGAGSVQTRHLGTAPAEDAAGGQVTAWTHGLTALTSQARPRGPRLPMRFCRYRVKI